MANKCLLGAMTSCCLGIHSAVETQAKSSRHTEAPLYLRVEHTREHLRGEL